jgi:hypothetical protein
MPEYDAVFWRTLYDDDPVRDELIGRGEFLAGAYECGRGHRRTSRNTLTFDGRNWCRTCRKIRDDQLEEKWARASSLRV